jgi:hypothetical protein
MKRRIAALGAAASAAILFGCATLKAEDVKVYQPAQLVQGQYETVARLWVETWRARTWVPTYSSPEEGVAALQDKAAGLGANGLTHVACYADKGWFAFGGDSYLCYGKAIKVP